jgi:hypothetical protein
MDDSSNTRNDDEYHDFSQLFSEPHESTRHHSTKFAIFVTLFCIVVIHYKGTHENDLCAQLIYSIISHSLYLDSSNNGVAVHVYIRTNMVHTGNAAFLLASHG